jgi:hypothetical protein
MPMPMLVDRLARRKELRALTECHKCGEPCRYIHDDAVWCRTCLDIEQYPQFSHLTQAEREQLRIDASKKDVKVSIVNAASVGFRAE